MAALRPGQSPPPVRTPIRTAATLASRGWTRKGARRAIAYYEALARLEIGVALVIQYMAPLLLLGWLRLFHGRRIARSLWGAVALSIAGCFLVVRAYSPGSLDAGLGVRVCHGLLGGGAAVVGFPFGLFDSPRNILIAAGVVVIGTLLPFICAVAATLEPVLAAVFAWFLHESLALVQVAGGALVLGAVL